MLAKETSEPFDDPNWLYEIKWDGYRAVAEVNKEAIRLYSRNGLSFNETYPVVAEQLQQVSRECILDGEIIVLNDEGNPDFQLLQHYSENRHRPIQYQVFDILNLDGKDVTRLSLLERKDLLKKMLPENEVIRYSDHILEQGKAFFEITKEKDLEGIMGKRTLSKYYPGKRTTDWLKIKHHKTTEAIIAGFTAPAGSRKHFGSLVLAVPDGKNYRYIGNAGTGFSDAGLAELFSVMKPLVTKNPPLTEKVKSSEPVTWLKPELICEIKYSERTKDGKLRHPVFLHLRPDKEKNEITMENKIEEAKNVAKKEAKTKVETGKPKKLPVKKTGKENEDREYTFGKNKVVVTHPDKIYFPADGITKGDVAEYYVSMSDYILPYLKGRPESLLRNPGGIHAKGFFHKDAAENVPSFVNKVIVHSESNDKDIDYIVCDNLATLVYMNNLGCIEINPWHSTIKDLEKPDYLIIDIDPSDKNTFDQVVEAALVVKEILDRAGAPSFCKTSGASGLHVYIPAGKKYTFEQLKGFAELICTLAQQQIPGFTTLTRNLSKRSNQKIYMDYLQNRRGQTIASAYSLRPKDGGTVSTPLRWDEVKAGLSPKQFTIFNIKERVDKVGDLFKGVLGKGIDISRCLENLE